MEDTCWPRGEMESAGRCGEGEELLRREEICLFTLCLRQSLEDYTAVSWGSLTTSHGSGTGWYKAGHEGQAHYFGFSRRMVLIPCKAAGQCWEPVTGCQFPGGWGLGPLSNSPWAPGGPNAQKGRGPHPLRNNRMTQCPLSLLLISCVSLTAYKLPVPPCHQALWGLQASDRKHRTKPPTVGFLI